MMKLTRSFDDMTTFTTMKWHNIILLSLTATFTIIGTYEIIALGLAQAYWSIMIALLFFFVYTIKRKQ